MTIESACRQDEHALPILHDGCMPNTNDDVDNRTDSRMSSQSVIAQMPPEQRPMTNFYGHRINTLAETDNELKVLDEAISILRCLRSARSATAAILLATAVLASTAAPAVATGPQLRSAAGNASPTVTKATAVHPLWMRIVM